MDLEIRPEFGNSGIRFVYEKGYMDDNQSYIPNELFQEIINFNNSYLPFARLSEKNKKYFGKELFELDKTGYTLKERTQNIWNYKVLYFSEAIQKHLEREPNQKDYFIYLKLNIFQRLYKYFLKMSLRNDTYGQY